MSDTYTYSGQSGQASASKTSSRSKNDGPGKGHAASEAPSGKTCLAVPELGEITGWEFSDGTKQFFGVPYATIPGRFKPSAISDSWPNARLDATHLGRYCPQPTRPPYPFFMPERPYLGDSVQGELECCNLSITVPPGTTKGDKHSVLVFLHGGAFTFGTANYSIVDGRPLARHSAELGLSTIICNVNYRIGWYGFLASDDIREDNGGVANGNWGLLDQRNALAWISKHIASFGGDASKVCLFGQSAGAISVDVFLQSPATWNLFRKAILMSGAIPICGNFTSDEYHLLYTKLLDVAGISRDLPPNERLAQLRAVPHEKLSSYTSIVFGGIAVPQFGPCDDGDLLGQGVHIPRTEDYMTLKYAFPGEIMIGDCEHEGIIYGNEFSKARLSPSELEDMVKRHLTPGFADQVLEHYKIARDMPEGLKFAAAESMITDGNFILPAHYAAMNSPEKVHRYHWYQRSQWDNMWGNGAYAHHSMDYMFVFGNMTEVMTPQEVRLSRIIAADYIRFANDIAPYPVFGSKQMSRVYGPSGNVSTVPLEDFAGRDAAWLDTLSEHASSFARLCFDISMRRDSILDVDIGKSVTSGQLVNDMCRENQEMPPL